jgi:protein ImuA
MHISSDKTEALEQLRSRVQAIEGLTRDFGDILPLGVADIDQTLPWGGLPLGCLHHVVGADEALGGVAPAAGAFVAATAGRLKSRGDVMWCLPRYKPADSLYGPGLSMLGLDEDDLILVRARDETEALWAMEEGLACADLAVVVGALTSSLSLTAERRLQLAAERGGTTGFLLQPGPSAATAGAAVTRWRVGSMPSVPPAWSGLGRPRWHLTLDRCRQGTTRSWIVEWCDETRDLRLAAPLCDRPADPVAVTHGGAALRAVA